MVVAWAASSASNKVAIPLMFPKLDPREAAGAVRSPPMEQTDQLPRIDEHSILVEAPRERVWEALLAVAERSVAAAGAPRYARLVGCEDVEAGGPRSLAPGSTMPGFHVESSGSPALLALSGGHRCSDYGLIFRLRCEARFRTRLRAET